MSFRQLVFLPSVIGVSLLLQLGCGTACQSWLHQQQRATCSSNGWQLNFSFAAKISCLLLNLFKNFLLIKCPSSIWTQCDYNNFRLIIIIKINKNNNNSNSVAVFGCVSEFIDVGKKQRALDALYDVIKSKRHRTWQKIHEPIMEKYLDLCVELKKSHIAKEGLYQYKNICQQVCHLLLLVLLIYYCNDHHNY